MVCKATEMEVMDQKGSSSPSLYQWYDDYKYMIVQISLISKDMIKIELFNK